MHGPGNNAPGGRLGWRALAWMKMSNGEQRVNGLTLPAATVVVTGASSGIGRATAMTFAREGANVVVAARNAEALAQVVQDCEGIGARALAVPTDVTDSDAVVALAQKAVEFGGRIDVWVNNVGVGAVGEFETTPIAAHDQVIRANLLGHLHGAHAVLPHFKRQEAGTLINVISVGGWVPTPYAASYSASKFGLRGFSEALRAELGTWRDIHVCDVFPAFIDTPGVQHGANYTGRQLKPAPPVYDPQDVADAILSLARFPRGAVTVGGTAHAARLAHLLMPGALGWLMARLMNLYFWKAPAAPMTDGNLFEPSTSDLTIRGGWQSPEEKPGNALGWTAVIGGSLLALYLIRPRRRPEPKRLRR